MASGNTLAVLIPAAGEPPSANYPSFDTRNNILVLDFDKSTDESIIFRGILPSNYGGGGVDIDIYWMAPTATTGDVVWGAQWEENDDNNNDLDSDAFGTAATATGSANATSGKLTKTTIQISHANMGSPAAGDPFRLKIYRDADDGSDTLDEDAELHSIHVKET